jgi:outer membrane protein assembly factor BamB
VYGPLVIVSADNKGGGAIAGLDRVTGKIVWRNERPKTPNYASPVIVSLDGKDRLVFTGCDLVCCLEPLTGKKLWEVKGATTECNHVAAMVADGSGKIAWENTARVYVPSMLMHEGHLYAVLDGGFAVCWKSDTGKEVWRGRLGGTFSASPVLVGDLIFATNEAGQTFLFRATPEGFRLLGRNQLGDEVLPTPTITGSRIYLRIASREKGRRQEMLYCLGTKE